MSALYVNIYKYIGVCGHDILKEVMRYVIRNPELFRALYLLVGRLEASKRSKAVFFNSLEILIIIQTPLKLSSISCNFIFPRLAWLDLKNLAW